MKTDFFQSCGHCWVFQICWHIKCSTFTASSFKLSKSLIQFSVDGWGCVPSLLFDLRPNYGEGKGDNGDFLQKVPCRHCCSQSPWPCSWPLSTSAGDSWTLTGTSGSVSCVVTYLEPDILECEVKWALESITTNKASGGDGIPVELFQIPKDYAVKVLHSICQQI